VEAFSTGKHASVEVVILHVVHVSVAASLPHGIHAHHHTGIINRRVQARVPQDLRMGGGQAPRANHLVHAAIKLIHRCSQHINIRVLLKKFKLPLKPLRLCDVVRIQARHKLRVDRGQSSG